MADMPASARARAAARFHAAILSRQKISPRIAAIVPAPQTAPGVSYRPGGRTMRRPLGPTYTEVASLRLSAWKLEENSAGIQRSGSCTWRTPTTELMPLQINRIASTRINAWRLATNEGTQKIGQNTAKYRAVCPTPAATP